MSWIEKLYKTYENNADYVGSGIIPLLPVGHTLKNAQIQITLDEVGNFLRAEVIPKNDAQTIIPATEQSAGRTNGFVPHPLSDKLQYIAADYKKYGGGKKPCFDLYCSQLRNWCESAYSHHKVRSVYNYIIKKRLIEDLVISKILYVDSSNKLLKTWDGDKKQMPVIFKLLQVVEGQSEAFVRWVVEIPGDLQSNLWTDKTVWQKWADYYNSLDSKTGLCYVTGTVSNLSNNHPRRIRNPGDGAKLISSNDKYGFTFLGRFSEVDQVYGVSFEITQKAHNTLRWLIERQGNRHGDQAIVAWAISGTDIPDPLDDTMRLLIGISSDTNTEPMNSTAQEIGIKLSKMIAGYSIKLGNTDSVIVLGLDSASEGRLAITFYRELTGSDFLERIQNWHGLETGCTWYQHISKEKIFIGAPSPADIAEAAYGRRIDENLRKATIERLLSCIIDGVRIPRDLVESCVRRASNKPSKNKELEYWDWEKALGIACAVFKNYYKERRYNMTLEKDRNSRDYLYGRILALAEHLEGRALNLAGEQRDTNAAKLMQRFANRPYSTWLTVETSLTPYKTRLVAKRPAFLQTIAKEIDDVMSKFITEEFTSDKPLSGEFLLSYHCQRKELRTRSENKD